MIINSLAMVHINNYLDNLDKENLHAELVTWDREKLIDWLCWNDPHGIYTDEESMDELGNIMSKEEGITIIMRQIGESKVIAI
ncbi:hypothetical protein HER18_05365 [Chryseobacterium sp. NEB161]|nr:hypothetical protein HER18_05365 [Chryseobacterium sp. NEB161]